MPIMAIRKLYILQYIEKNVHLEKLQKHIWT